MPADLMLVKSKTIQRKDEIDGLLEGGYSRVEDWDPRKDTLRKGGILVSVREKSIFRYPTGATRVCCEVKEILNPKSPENLDERNIKLTLHNDYSDKFIFHEIGVGDIIYIQNPHVQLYRPLPNEQVSATRHPLTVHVHPRRNAPLPNVMFIIAPPPELERVEPIAGPSKPSGSIVSATPRESEQDEPIAGPSRLRSTFLVAQTPALEQEEPIAGPSRLRSTYTDPPLSALEKEDPIAESSKQSSESRVADQSVSPGKAGSSDLRSSVMREVFGSHVVFTPSPNPPQSKRDGTDLEDIFRSDNDFTPSQPASKHSSEHSVQAREAEPIPPNPHEQERERMVTPVPSTSTKVSESPLRLSASPKVPENESGPHNQARVPAGVHFESSTRIGIAPLSDQQGQDQVQGQVQVQVQGQLYYKKKRNWDYKPLENCCTDRGRFNTWAILREISELPKRRKSMLVARLKIVDPSIGPLRRYRFDILDKTMNLIPSLTVNSVLRIHDMKVEVFRGEPDGRVYSGRCVTVVKGGVGDPIEPEFTKDKADFCWDEKDAEKVKELRAWFQQVLQEDQKDKTLEEIRQPGLCNLYCRVVSIMQTKRNSTVIRVEDGTQSTSYSLEYSEDTCEEIIGNGRFTIDVFVSDQDSVRLVHQLRLESGTYICIERLRCETVPVEQSQQIVEAHPAFVYCLNQVDQSNVVVLDYHSSQHAELRERLGVSHNESVDSYLDKILRIGNGEQSFTVSKSPIVQSIESLSPGSALSRRKVMQDEMSQTPKQRKADKTVQTPESVEEEVNKWIGESTPVSRTTCQSSSHFVKWSQKDGAQVAETTRLPSLDRREMSEHQKQKEDAAHHDLKASEEEISRSQRRVGSSPSAVRSVRESTPVSRKTSQTGFTPHAKRSLTYLSSEQQNKKQKHDSEGEKVEQLKEDFCRELGLEVSMLGSQRVQNDRTFEHVDHSIADTVKRRKRFRSKKVAVRLENVLRMPQFQSQFVQIKSGDPSSFFVTIPSVSLRTRSVERVSSTNSESTESNYPDAQRLCENSSLTRTTPPSQSLHYTKISTEGEPEKDDVTDQFADERTHRGTSDLPPITTPPPTVSPDLSSASDQISISRRLQGRPKFKHLLGKCSFTEVKFRNVKIKQNSVPNYDSEIRFKPTPRRNSAPANPTSTYGGKLNFWSTDDNADDVFEVDDDSLNQVATEHNSGHQDKTESETSTEYHSFTESDRSSSQNAQNSSKLDQHEKSVNIFSHRHKGELLPTSQFGRIYAVESVNETFLTCPEPTPSADVGMKEEEPSAKEEGRSSKDDQNASMSECGPIEPGDNLVNVRKKLRFVAESSHCVRLNCAELEMAKDGLYLLICRISSVSPSLAGFICFQCEHCDGYTSVKDVTEKLDCCSKRKIDRQRKNLFFKLRVTDQTGVTLTLEVNGREAERLLGVNTRNLDKEKDCVALLKELPGSAAEFNIQVSSRHASHQYRVVTSIPNPVS